MLPRVVVVVTVAATLDQWRMGAGPNKERRMAMCHDYTMMLLIFSCLGWMTIEERRWNRLEKPPSRSLVRKIKRGKMKKDGKKGRKMYSLLREMLSSEYDTIHDKYLSQTCINFESYFFAGA